MVRIPDAVVSRYDRFSLYNSPYPAHDHGCAIDLYPAAGAPSPVAGRVRAVETVRAPRKPYSPPDDHLVLVDVDRDATGLAPGDPLVARIMHVDPVVAPGDDVAVGEDLGSLVRAGFFAPWVGNHLHVGFRRPDQHLVRATGSLFVAVDVTVEPLTWDGTGTVAAVADTYVVLDAPAHPGDGFAGIATDAGAVLDGGFPHYAGGGVLGGRDGPVSLLGTEIGTATGRDVSWADRVVHANDTAVTGLSFFVGRPPGFGAKLVAPDHAFAVGDHVTVSFR